jgi:uncharacterized DUF497 family protein
MEFEWNPKKAEINLKKHGISFEKANTVFGDYLSVTFPDPDHSKEEERFLIIGLSNKHRILVISHTYRNDKVRIISARIVTKREKKFYEHRKSN